MRRVVVLFVALGYAPLCRAGSFIDRPLVLPPLSVRPQAAWEMVAVRSIDRSPASTGHWLQLGIDAGVGFGLQVGVAASQELSPDASFDRAALRSLLSLSQDAALRLDFGPYRFNRQTETGWAGGLGAVLRLPLIPGKVALLTGRTIALPPIGGTLGLAFADDFVTIDLNHSNITATVGIPLQLLVEPAEGFALALRSGYRHGWGGGNFSADWVPLGADLLVNVARRVDFVASAEVPGETSSYGSFESLTALFFVRGTVAVTF